MPRLSLIDVLHGASQIERRPLSYEKAVIRCLLASVADPSDTRYGVLTPEEVAALESLIH